MQFTHIPDVIFGAEAWQATVGAWNFFISHPYSSDGRFYCSLDKGETRIIFFNKEEVIVPVNLDEASVPYNFGHKTLEEAIKNCEEKYKELLLR